MVETRAITTKKLIITILVINIIIIIERNTFNNNNTNIFILIDNNEYSVVDVYQDWCGPCKAMVPIFKRIKNETGDELLRFAMVAHYNNLC